MIRRAAWAGWIVLILSVRMGLAQTAETKADFQQLFGRMAAASFDSCDGPLKEPADEHQIERMIPDAAETRILDGLNAVSAKPEQAKGIIDGVLKPLEQMSDKAEAAWPRENRFHFAVMEVLPAIVVKFTYRNTAHFRAYGIAQASAKGESAKWIHLGEDEWESSRDPIWSSLKLYPLHRGPSGAVRFLVELTGGGCAGPFGEDYAIEEWDPAENKFLSEVVRVDGALGLDASPEHAPTKQDPFPTVGTLKIEGSRITLPYCEFTQLDTWDNPSLCMVDTYDLSGDAIQFAGRRYNRPDLAPVAKVLEYAKAHDLPALRAYCVSDAVAQKIGRELPGGYVFDDELQVISLGGGRERVKPAYSDDRGFVVENAGARWLVVSFQGK